MSLVDRGATRLIEATDIPEGTVTYLAENADIKQTGYRDTIAVRAPDETEVSFFKIPADGRVPMFEIFRVGFDQNGNLFRLTVTVYPADRNQFALNVGEVPDHDVDPSTSRAREKPEPRRLGQQVLGRSEGAKYPGFHPCHSGRGELNS